MELNALETFLKNVDIPEIKPQPKTFLGIARQPHYENVLSNIYAFFFDVDEEHGFGDLFITSLVEIIRNSNTFDKDELNALECLDPHTEVGTKNNGRIDILLSNEDQAIIIENKVYHVLNNDLHDYWNSTKAKFKVGIVLSLNEIKAINHPSFINITHKQLLNTVFANLGTYILDGNDKYLVFLQDLYQNMINLSSKNMKLEEIELYLDNQSEINKVIKFDQDFRNYVISEVERAYQLLSSNHSLDLAAKRISWYRYYCSKKISNLVIVVVFGEIFKDTRNLSLIVEPRYQNIQRVKNIRGNIEFTDEEKKVLVENFNEDNNKEWAHFARAVYTLENENMLSLGDFIYDKIINDNLLSIFKKLENELEKIS